MRETLFDIEWIIALIKEQEPTRPDLIAQLEKADRKKWIRRKYLPFVLPDKPNQHCPEWQIDEHLILEHETEGTIVLDVLKNGRISGIEFVDQIP